MRRPHLNYANVTSTLALVLALGGTSAYAAGQISSRDIKNGAVRSVDVADRTIKQQDVAPGGLGSRAIKDRSIKKRDLGYAGVSDVEWVTNAEASGSWFRNNAAAVCPAGKEVIGGTAEVTGGGDSVALHAVQRAPADEVYDTARVIARAHEHTPTEDNWTLVVTAVCAFVG